MTTWCQYHPADNARWSCDRCNLPLCNTCMPDADRKNHKGFCPRCNSRLHYLGDGTRVEPFWNRVPTFFTYPFASAPLAVIGICTFVPLIIPQELGLLAIGILLLLWGALTKYLYRVVEITAQGNLTPPSVGDAFSSGGLTLFFRQLAVFILMFTLVGVTSRFLGVVAASILSLFLLFALPASIMSLALEEDAMAAFNPLNLLLIMSRIGWPYVVMVTHIVLLISACGVMVDFAFSHSHRYLAGPFTGYITSYFMVVIFHLIGYVLYQYQEHFGLGAGSRDDDEPRPDAGRQTRLEADLDMAIKDGEYDKAQTLLETSLKQHPHHTRHQDKLWRLVMARPANEPLIRHYRRFLQMLVKENRSADLIATLKRLETVPGFELTDGPVLLGACQMLYHAGEYRTLLQLAKDLHKRLPTCAEIPEVYLLVARTLANGMNQRDKAASFLKFVQLTYPGHPSQKQVNRLQMLLAENQRLD